MKVLYWIFIFLIALSFQINAQLVSPYWVDSNQVVYKKPTTEILHSIKVLKINTRSFSNGIGAVKEGKQWVFINADGSYFIDTKFDFIFPSKSGFFMVSNFHLDTNERYNYRFGLVNNKHQLLANQLFETVGIYNDSICTAKEGGINYYFKNDSIIEIPDSISDNPEHSAFDQLNDSLKKRLMEINLPVYQFTKQAPGFIEGEKAYRRFLWKHLEYPEYCREQCIQGTVYYNIIIEPDGSASHLNIMRGVHPEIDMEALKAIYLIPKWKPAKSNDEAVRCYFTHYIKFHVSC